MAKIAWEIENEDNHYDYVMEESGTEAVAKCDDKILDKDREMKTEFDNEGENMGQRQYLDNASPIDQDNEERVK